MLCHAGPLSGLDSIQSVQSFVHLQTDLLSLRRLESIWRLQRDTKHGRPKAQQARSSAT